MWLVSIVAVLAVAFVAFDDDGSAQEPSEGYVDSYVDLANGRARDAIIALLLSEPGALEDPPSIPGVFDADGDGRIEIPERDSRERLDFDRWLLDGVDPATGQLLATDELGRIDHLQDVVAGYYERITPADLSDS